MPVVEVPLFIVRSGRLIGGRPRAWDRRGLEGEAAIEAIAAARKPDEMPYLFDADGVDAGAPQHEFYQRLERRGIHPWIEAGVRTPEDAMDAFFAGAEALTLDLRLLRRETLLELAGLAEGELHLGLGFVGRETVPAFRAWELQRVAHDTQASGVVLQPDAGADAHALAGFAKELQSQRIQASLLSWDRGSPPPEGFARWIRPGAAP
ncbi:MAG TPA: hypothetical protein VI818_04405 [Candidatus Thermoplasmatota archaeon]|nr:hypothetical protein [Candidatus Thermoplasmatota archaeon]